MLLGTLLTAGCLAAGGGDPDVTPAGSQGCGACETQLAALSEAIEGLQGVETLEGLTYTSAALTTPPVVSFRLRLRSTGDPTAVADAAAETVWRSEVTPLGRVSLMYSEPDGPLSRPVAYEFASERAAYEEKWGPRPVPAP